MVYEGLLNYFGTSSEEIAEKATQKAREQDKQFYQPQIDALTAKVTQLEQLLSQNNIAY